jgi:hypothetical protein
MNLFLIGAGFTKSIYPYAPLNNELLQALANDKVDCASLKLTNDYETNDIEIALTMLDVEIAEQLNSENPWEQRVEELQDIRRKIESDIGNYFYQFRATNDHIEKLPWLKYLIDNAFSDGDVAVSLNYDCVFEGALDCRSKWSPISGYGDYAFFENPLIDKKSYPKSPVTVLKIHGSSSFVIAPPIGDPDSRSIGFIFDEWFFPKSAKSKHFRYGLGEGKTYITAPSYVKVPTVEITYFMLDALKASEQALNLIVICCGLRPEDTFLTTLLTNFLHQNNWCSRKIVIVDLNAEAIANRIKAYWGVNLDSCIFPIEKRLENAIEELISLMRD